MQAPRRIDDLLLKRGLVSADQLRIAALEQKARNQPLGEVLVSLGFASEGAVRDALAEALEQPCIDLAPLLPDPEAIALVPLDMAKRFQVVPVSHERESRRLLLATADPLNLFALDQISALLGGIDVQPVLAGKAEIGHAIQRFYGFAISIDAILHEMEGGGDMAAPNLRLGEEERQHPMVRLVDALIADAVKQGASDIHFEPERTFLRVRYRVDGVLRQARSVHANYWPAMAVRLKVMAALNIAETRTPQDGHITLPLHGRTIDFRVSTLPTLHGENIVLRVLDRQAGIIPLSKLGLDEEAFTALRLMMARPEGILLVTGPTGSGKTTTLYSMLGALDVDQANIMTLEDPVEYPMTGIRQSAVNEATRLDFADGVRAILRQDPDVILIGEIRDAATAEMALRAAMTGHQVYSTLHTPSALGAIPRLLELGIPADILAGNVIGVVGQRLVRKLCLHCREAHEPTAPERRLLGKEAPAASQVWRAKGCPRCDYHGYRGRLALMEVLRFDDTMDELVGRRATTRELLNAALLKGFRTLAEDGIRRVIEGATSMDEVSRVVDLTARLR